MLPNYKDGSIVNLMSSIAGAFNGKTGYSELKILDSEKLKSKNIVLIVVDGLGYEYLKKKKSVFNENLAGSMTSVFLSTTASAITSFLTGVAPQQHAFTGWYIFLKEIGVISRILPFNLRVGGPELSFYGVDIKDILEEKNFFKRIKASCYSVIPEKIFESDFTNLTSEGSRKLGYRTMNGFFKQIKRAINHSKKRKYIYAYWSEFDSICHENGIGSRKCEKHFKELDKKMRRFLKSVEGTNTTVIVSADHGFTNIDLKNWIWVDKHPKLKECLTMPLCGEGRVAFCYVKPSRVKEFEKYVSSKSDLFVFPESTFVTNNLEFEKFFKNLCKKIKSRIIVGIIVKGKKTYNYSYYFSPNKIERYQKIHVHWTNNYVPGNKFKVIKTKLGKIGLLICYDVAFQETGRILALKGADIIVTVSDIPLKFPYKYNLLRHQAMALNNQLFVVDCSKPGKNFSGHSTIFDPQGNLLLELGKNKSVKSKNIDLFLINKWRKKEKIFSYRKPKLYADILKK